MRRKGSLIAEERVNDRQKKKSTVSKGDREYDVTKWNTAEGGCMPGKDVSVLRGCLRREGRVAQPVCSAAKRVMTDEAPMGASNIDWKEEKGR